MSFGRVGAGLRLADRDALADVTGRGKARPEFLPAPDTFEAPGETDRTRQAERENALRVKLEAMLRD